MQNRRRGPDFVIKVMNYISGTAWVMIFAIFVFVSMAKPKFQGFKRGMGAIHGSWDTDLLSVVFGLLIFLVLMSVIGIAFNITRMKRKTDNIRASLVISGIVASIGIIIYLVR